jgi:hypothetical protein
MQSQPPPGYHHSSSNYVLYLCGRTLHCAENLHAVGRCADVIYRPQQVVTLIEKGWLFNQRKQILSSVSGIARDRLLICFVIKYKLETHGVNPRSHWFYVFANFIPSLAVNRTLEK